MQITALAVLLPVVSALGGNSGAQAAAVVMRSLALKEILLGSASRLLTKEVVVGMINGVGVAPAAAIIVWFWFGNPTLSLVIASVIMVNMIVAALAGTSIPFILQALERDPAQSSQISLTTVTEVIGIAAFLGLSLLFNPMLV